MYPGGHTVVDMTGFQGSGAPIQPIQLGAFPDRIFEVWTKKNEQVAAAFFRDILELPSMRDKNMTATEINARLDQYLRQVAPVMSRVNDGYNAALVNRVFNIMMRENRYPPPPEEMYGEEIDFDYESPIKSARDKAEAMKIVEGLSMVLPLAEANPSILDNYDFDAIARITGMKSDMPPGIFVPIEAMMEKRAEREKQMKQMQMAELASKVAPAVNQLASGASTMQQSGMMGEPMQLPSPGLVSGEAMDEEMGIMEGVFEEVA